MKTTTRPSRTELHIWLHLAFFALIALWLVPMNVTRDFPDLNAKQVALIGFLIVGNLSTLGTAFGYYTRELQPLSGA